VAACFWDNPINPHMKTVSIIALVAAPSVGVLFAPLNFETAVSAIFATGFLGILVADYARLLRPDRLQLTPVNFSTSRSERLRLAA
jgi:xanthosine utilization system XapX-like protein